MGNATSGRQAYLRAFSQKGQLLGQEGHYGLYPFPSSVSRFSQSSLSWSHTLPSAPHSHLPIAESGLGVQPRTRSCPPHRSWCLLLQIVRGAHVLIVEAILVQHGT